MHIVLFVEKHIFRMIILPHHNITKQTYDGLSSKKEVVARKI